MNKQYVEFDDLERDFEGYLDRVVRDGIVVVITAQSIPLAAIVPLPLWERLQKTNGGIENVESL
ncbi:unnamed protein product [marine sediment metagenome]|uniref:Prevent-host-death family protein n=1 Tax=marine sediment metagenome TaxID=412755 RepID=X0W447_9ZZZZ